MGGNEGITGIDKMTIDELKDFFMEHWLFIRQKLLSNVLLDELDKELYRRGHKFCCYADDCIVYVRSARAGAKVMASFESFLYKR